MRLGGWFLSTILSLKLLKFTDLNSSIVFVCQNAMTSLIVATWYIVRFGKAVEESQKVVNCTFTHCVQTTYNVCSTYKYFKYSSTYKYLVKYLSISTSTLGKLRKYLSKVQVLSNLYLSVLKYKYSCTWPHVCLYLVSWPQWLLKERGVVPKPKK